MATLNLVGTGDTNWAAKQNANLTNINNELIATTAKANAAQVAADLDDDTAALAADSESALRTELNAAFVLKENAALNVRDFGALGDGVTNDASAAAVAAAASDVVLYPAGTYLGAGAFGNAYSPTNYKDAIGERVMGGLRGAPIDNPLPLMWVQKHSSVNRSVNPNQWDNGAVYASLIKESGDASGAALTGFARHESVGGDLIGVHGRGMATKTTSRVWGGWFYAGSIDAAAATHPSQLIGVEINVSHHGEDTGWSKVSTANEQAGLVIMAADGSNPITHGIIMGAAASPNGAFHNGLVIPGDAIVPVALGTDFATGIGNNEAILLRGRTTDINGHNGIRFMDGYFGVGISFKEASFRDNKVMLLGSHQRIAVGAGLSATTFMELVADDVNTRYLNLSNMLLRINDNQVLGARKTGWTTNPTGTLTRTTFNSDSVTLAELAQRVGALIVDLRNHGLIGP